MGIFAKIKKAWFDTIVWETIDDEFYDELVMLSITPTSSPFAFSTSSRCSVR